MITTCQNCGKKVKLPDEPRKDAKYICLGCNSVLTLMGTTEPATIPSQESPEFKLKVAKGFVDEVAEQTEDVVALQKFAHDEERFWEGLKKSWKAGAAVQRLQDDLNKSIELAIAASKMNPAVRLADGSSPKTVVAQARFQAGLIEFRLGNWEKALEWFNRAQKSIPAQEVLFNIALCKLNLMKRFDLLGGLKNPTKAWQKRFKIFTPWEKGALDEVADGWKEGFSAQFTSGKFSEQEIIDTFVSAVNMDPESDIAVEAGKILARLGR